MPQDVNVDEFVLSSYVHIINNSALNNSSQLFCYQKEKKMEPIYHIRQDDKEENGW